MDEDREWPTTKRRRLWEDHHNISSSTSVQTPSQQQHPNLEPKTPYSSQRVSSDLRLPSFGYLSNTLAAHDQNGRVTGVQPYVEESPVRILHPGQPQTFAPEHIIVNHEAEYGRHSSAWNSPNPPLPPPSHIYSSSQVGPWRHEAQAEYHYHAQLTTLPRLDFPALHGSSTTSLPFSQTYSPGYIGSEVLSSSVGENNSEPAPRTMQIPQVPLDGYRTMVPSPAKEIVCFGMVSDLTSKSPGPLANPRIFHVRFLASRQHANCPSSRAAQRGLLPASHPQMHLYQIVLIQAYKVAYLQSTDK